MSTAADECPLSPRQQLRNVFLYSLNVSLTYFIGPVMYVGILQSALCKFLGKDDVIANLAGSTYLWATPLPVIVAWCFPQVRALKPLMVAGYLCEVVITALFLAALFYGSKNVIVAMLVAHAGVLGFANGVANSCLWELLGRGVSTSRRGLAFTFAFGFGPFMAVIGSLGAQFILGEKDSLRFGTVGEWFQPVLNWFEMHLGGYKYPVNYQIIFGVCIPAMLICAIASSLIVVPMTEAERREPMRPKIDLSNLGLSDFFGNRLILLAGLAYILVYAGEQITPNMNSYIQTLLGKTPQSYAGLCQALRFAFKIVAGFLLGWLTTFGSPKLTVYVTSMLTLAGIAWAISVPGELYLLGFGLLGAGELMGNYFPNYILHCSQPHQMRRNMYYTNMITFITGFAGVFYGTVSRRWGELWSFYCAFGIVASSFVVILLLPNRPKPAPLSSPEPNNITPVS